MDDFNKGDLIGMILGFIIALLLCASVSHAEEFYCTPNKDDSYTCRKVDFEIREFQLSIKHKCHKAYNKDEWICFPFDEGAILLEPVHNCTDYWSGYNVIPLYNFLNSLD